MLGMFLAALEATAVAAEVPTAVVGELGGVGRYSWVFSAYLLASTVTVPLYGKLADIYGRRPVYQASMALFLGGSVLCGIAGSFGQLVLFRALQGLGAGGVTPIGATVIGVYTLEERGRVQGLFSGVWAIASLAGPLLGGLITDALSWRWIFLVNVPFGIASAWLLSRHLTEERPPREHPLDLYGTAILTLAITCLLFALTEGVSLWSLRDPRTLAFLAAAGAGLLLFLRQERRAPEPMLPLDLFRIRLIAVASAGNTLIGAVLLPSAPTCRSSRRGCAAARRSTPAPS